MKIRILVSGPSNGAKELADELSDLGVKRCNLVHTKFKPHTGDLVLNWGCVAFPTLWDSVLDHDGWTLLNPPHLVLRSGNRLKSLPIMKEAGINVPEHTTNFDTASQWLLDGRTVVARQAIRSSGGKGLSIHKLGGVPLVQAKLYTVYKPKRHEYRVHIFRGEVIDVQQKRRAKGVTVDPKIRSYANGWRFCRIGVQVSDLCLSSAVQACHSLGLDFGAVDVGWNEKHQEAMVYEVNTAPGLEGTTVLKYAEAIRKAVKGL